MYNGLGFAAGRASHNWPTEPMSGKTKALESSLQKAVARVSLREPHWDFKTTKVKQNKGQGPKLTRGLVFTWKVPEPSLVSICPCQWPCKFFNCPAKSSPWHFGMRQNSRFIVTTQTEERAVSQQGWERDYWGSSAFQVFFFFFFTFSQPKEQAAVMATVIALQGSCGSWQWAVAVLWEGVKRPGVEKGNHIPEPNWGQDTVALQRGEGEEGMAWKEKGHF